MRFKISSCAPKKPVKQNAEPERNLPLITIVKDKIVRYSNTSGVKTASSHVPLCNLAKLSVCLSSLIAVFMSIRCCEIRIQYCPLPSLCCFHFHLLGGIQTLRHYFKVSCHLIQFFLKFTICICTCVLQQKEIFLFMFMFTFTYFTFNP